MINRVFNILLIIIELFILELRKFEEEIILRFLDLLAKTQNQAKKKDTLEMIDNTVLF